MLIATHYGDYNYCILDTNTGSTVSVTDQEINSIPNVKRIFTIPSFVKSLGVCVLREAVFIDGIASFVCKGFHITHYKFIDDFQHIIVYMDYDYGMSESVCIGRGYCSDYISYEKNMSLQDFIRNYTY